MQRLSIASHRLLVDVEHDGDAERAPRHAAHFDPRKLKALLLCDAWLFAVFLFQCLRGTGGHVRR